MKKSHKIALVVIGVIAIMVVAFLISSVVIMFVWNVLAGYFGFKKITLLIAFFISLALWIIGGAFKNNNKK